MYDIKFVRNNLDLFCEKLSRRKLYFDRNNFTILDNNFTIANRSLHKLEQDENRVNTNITNCVEKYKVILSQYDTDKAKFQAFYANNIKEALIRAKLQSFDFLNNGSSYRLSLNKKTVKFLQDLYICLIQIYDDQLVSNNVEGIKNKLIYTFDKLQTFLDGLLSYKVHDDEFVDHMRIVDKLQSLYATARDVINTCNDIAKNVVVHYKKFIYYLNDVLTDINVHSMQQPISENKQHLLIVELRDLGCVNEKYYSYLVENSILDDNILAEMKETCVTCVTAMTNLYSQLLIIQYTKNHVYNKVEYYRDKLHNLLAQYPNLPSDVVPDTDVVVREHKCSPVNLMDEAERKDHIAIAGDYLGIENATRLSGSQFSCLLGSAAIVEHAICNLMMNVHIKNGFVMVSPPLLVKPQTMFGTGQLPKFYDDLYHTGDDFFLIPTAEVPLANLHRDTILNKSVLPLRYVAFTQCMRQEAGSSGKNLHGLIRLHQFPKVELVSITVADDAENELEYLLSSVEKVLKLLDLTYRVRLLRSDDLGFAAAQTYDLEVFMYGMQVYQEISSVSLCTEFQARRMKARYRDDGGNLYVTTLNGSGVAVGRAVAAFLERYQQKDGSVLIPDVLRPFMPNNEEKVVFPVQNLYKKK